jgi:hypothetical protein
MKKLLENVFLHMIYYKQKKSCNWITIIEFTTEINVKGKFHGKQWSHGNHAKTRCCGLFINCTGAMNRKRVRIKHEKSRKNRSRAIPRKAKEQVVEPVTNRDCHQRTLDELLPLHDRRKRGGTDAANRGKGAEEYIS